MKRKILATLLACTLTMTSVPTTLFAKEIIETPQPMTALVESQTTTSAAIEIKPNKYVGEGYEVEFKVVNKWPGAFQGELVLTNTGDQPLENWTMAYDFEHEITNMWNAQIVTHEANNYIIKNVVHNQDIAVGSSVNIGFQANWNDVIKIPESYDMLIAKQEVENTDYTIDFKVTGDWGQAFNGEMSITNNTEETIEDWTLEFDFDRNIERFWTAEIVEHDGNHYTIKNAGYNANIAPRQTITLGFSGNPGNVDNKPINYVLNQLGQEIDYEKDTDGDGLPDWFEKEIGTDSNNVDTDGDGLPDGYEYLFTKTDPLVVDTNGDGISDADEDLDADGLINLEEFKLHTNPLEVDTDHDGLSDSDEVRIYSTDPTKYDTDGDMLSDGDEIEIGLDPNNIYTHDSILDSKYCFDQAINTQPLSNFNEENDYSLSVSVVAAGNAKKELNVTQSDITGAITENRAIVGKVVNLEYSEKKFQSAELNFSLKDEYLDNTTNMFPDEEIFNTVERYQVFRFDRDKMVLYPIETSFNEGDNSLSVSVTQLGDYCVIDMQEWLFDIGLLDSVEPQVTEYSIKSVEDDLLPEKSNEVQPYEDVSRQELEEIISGSDDEQEASNNVRNLLTLAETSSSKVNRQADLVFVVDTTGSMSSYIATVKSQIANVINYLRNQKITLHISFVEYRDITYDGIDSTILHEKNSESWLYNTTDMIDVLKSLQVNGGGDGPETPIDGLAMAEGLDYRKTASKYVVLVTDASFKTNNNYGISNMDEMANMLKDKGIYTCVVGAYGYYRNLYTTTDGIGLNISNFAPELDEFIMGKMNTGNGQTYLDGLDFTPGELVDKLVKDSDTDSDGDGLPDSDEVNWDYISIEDGNVHVSTLGEILDKLTGSSSSIFDRFTSLLLKLHKTRNSRSFSLMSTKASTSSNEIMNLPVLMASTTLKTSALKKDSDGDSFIDIDDPRFGDDNADRFDGLHFYYRNGLNGQNFIIDPSNKMLMHSGSAAQEISMVWTGNAYKLYCQDYPDLVLTCTGNWAEMKPQKRNDEGQKWQVIPKKDSSGYILKSLYHSDESNANGSYVDSSYNNTKYVWLDGKSKNTSWVTLEEASEITDWLTFNQICYDVKNRKADSDEIGAYNNYLANKIVLENNNGFNNGHDAVYGQHLSPFNQLRLGNHTMDYNGCEVFGTYNALLKAGVNIDVLKLTCEFEVNGLMFNPDKGGFGSESKKIAECLDNFAVSYKEIKTAKEIDEALKNNEFVIITVWNSPTIFDGIHTFATRYDSSKSDVEFYNYYCNLTKTYGYKSVESLMKSENWGAIIRAYAITK